MTIGKNTKLCDRKTVPMFGGICNTTPSDLINLLCKDIPRLVLVVSDQRDKIQDPIMRAIADEMTVETQSTRDPI